MRSNMIGAGASNVLDTYLSPYNYSGLDIRFMHEYMRQTSLMDNKVAFQSLWDANAGLLENRVGNVNEYAFGLRYSAAWLYSLTPQSSLLNSQSSPSFSPRSPRVISESLHLSLGLQPSAYLGGIYNSRNGNNPAQLKADIMLNAVAMLQYRLRLFKKVFPLRYQLTVPLLGIAYSPNYGQSYYEEFGLGNYDHNICFAHIANMPSMRHLLTLDIPIRRNYLTIGWTGQFNQAKLNGLKYHSYSNNLLIGLTKRF